MTTAFASLLTVKPVSAHASNKQFIGAPHSTVTGRSFGGQIMGQAAYAASLTVPQEHSLHSLHGYFMRPGRASEHTVFTVDDMFDGRSFATRRAQAIQNEQTIMSLIASFQKPTHASGFSDSCDLSQFPDPDTLQPVTEKYFAAADSSTAHLLTRPFEFRYVQDDVHTRVTQPATTQQVWVRATAALSNANQFLQRAALTFVSDYLYLEPALRGYGVPWRTPGLKAASLDLAIWFHRDVDVTTWLLYDLRCVHAADGRALTTGRFFNRAGDLVATCAQEAMLRLPHHNHTDLSNR